MSKPTHVPPPPPGQTKRRTLVQDDITAGPDEPQASLEDASVETSDVPEGEDVGAAPEDEAEAQGSDANSATEAPLSDFRDQRIKMLEAALDEREKTLQDYIRAHKRAQVEFESFKTRMRANEKGHADIARGKVVERMLDVYDNLQRSLEASRLADTVDDLRAGVELVARDLQRLEELGLKRFDPIGQPFDPTCMEAMGVVPVAEDARNGMVVMTLKPGFRLNEREIRPAMVQVGRKF